jgi:hypothetical protein
MGHANTMADSRSLDSQMGEVYTDDNKHIENPSDNEETTRHLILSLLLTYVRNDKAPFLS